MKKPKQTKYELLGYLLGEFGSDRITRDQFWGQMKQLGYTQDDIDKWCDEFYQLEAQKELDDARRKETQGGTERAEPARFARGTGIESQGADRQDLRATEGVETARQDGRHVQEASEAQRSWSLSGEGKDMTNLDINTPLGQVTLTHEEKAIELFEKQYPAYKFVHTDKTTMAKCDGIVRCDDQIEGIILTSCRKHCTLETFMTTWNAEAILTYRKLTIGAQMAKYFQTALVGFFYIVNEDALLIQSLYDPLMPKESRWLTPIRIDRTWTQANVNGGNALRRNAYIKIDKAKVVRR